MRVISINEQGACLFHAFHVVFVKRIRVFYARMSNTIQCHTVFADYLPLQRIKNGFTHAIIRNKKIIFFTFNDKCYSVPKCSLFQRI